MGKAIHGRLRMPSLLNQAQGLGNSPREVARYNQVKQVDVKVSITMPRELHVSPQ